IDLIGRRGERNSESVHGAAAIRPAFRSRPVKTAVTAVNQPASWSVAANVGRGGKGVQIRVAAGGADAKNAAVIVRAADKGRAIEIAVAALDKRGLGFVALTGGAGKGVQIRVVAVGTDP